MTRRVRFRWLTEDGDVADRGTITWDGAQLHADPGLEHLLEQRVRVPGAGVISADQGPESFLEALQFNYRGAYLTALPPEDVT